MDQLLTVVCFINVIIGTFAVRLNITGSEFQKDRLTDSYVVIAHEQFGPKLCIKECMHYKDCNAVNFKRDDLFCELLTVSYPGDQITSVTGSFFSEIGNWTQDPYQCWPNPCDSGTKCVAAYHDQYICVTYDIPCNSQPCVNNGVCRHGVESTYRCICPEGFYGTNCEYTPCTGKYCNYGTCVISGSSFYCSCPSGYYGDSCEHTPCTGKNCNYGTCVISGSSYYCSCNVGYSGTNCEILSECKTTDQGTEYRGLKHTTKNGIECQRWNSDTPHAHGSHAIDDQQNYCRNPDGESEGPWCYTSDPIVRWENCGIPYCS